MCIPTGFNGFSYLIYVTDDQIKENTIFINFLLRFICCECETVSIGEAGNKQAKIATAIMKCVLIWHTYHHLAASIKFFFRKLIIIISPT